MISRAMQNRNLLAAIAAVTLLASCEHKPATSAPSASQSTPAPVAANAAIVTLADGAPIEVEVAANDDTRTQGLMYRDVLLPGKGMIFIFKQPGDYAFWMKNTIIPLDMIWIDDAHRIVHVEHDVQPCKADPCPSYPPNAQARFVLELAAGEAKKHALANGQVVRYTNIDNVPVR